MNILNFNATFPDEASCIAHFKAERDTAGVVCPKCGCREHYWLKNKLRYECKQCHTRQSLRSGTVMQYTKLPFQYWYVAMHLLTATKKSFSAAELQRQLGHRRYQPVWELCNKLRDVMGKRDDSYKLSGEIEIDNAFVTTPVVEEQKDKPLKRGAGSQNKTKIVVMAESTQVDNPQQGKKPKRVNHLKMKVTPDLKADTTANMVSGHVERDAGLTTGASTSYNKLKEHAASHAAQAVKKKDVAKVLPRVHIATANLKRLLLDVHRQVKGEYLQYYLNGFCYKFNRRYFGEKLFDRLIFVAVRYNTDFKSRIYNRSLCG